MVGSIDSGLFVTFAADADGGGIMATFAAMMGTILLIFAAIFIFSVIVLWKIFDKAGQPGWAAIVPIYNAYVLIVEVCQLSIVWFIVYLIPCTSFIAAIMVALKLAEKFGKEVGFAVGLILLPIIFYPLLAFGDARYRAGKPGYGDVED
jgi:hypothetical protein